MTSFCGGGMRPEPGHGSHPLRPVHEQDRSVTIVDDDVTAVGRLLVTVPARIPKACCLRLNRSAASPSIHCPAPPRWRRETLAAHDKILILNKFCAVLRITGAKCTAKRNADNFERPISSIAVRARLVFCRAELSLVV